MYEAWTSWGVWTWVAFIIVGLLPCGAILICVTLSILGKPKKLVEWLRTH